MYTIGTVEAKANEDFDSLGLSNITNPKPGMRMGTLPDGKIVNVRLDSTDGRPTLEIQHEATRRSLIKIRYNK